MYWLYCLTCTDEVPNEKSYGLVQLLLCNPVRNCCLTEKPNCSTLIIVVSAVITVLGWESVWLLTNCSTDKTSWSPWCFCWVGEQCLKWINWQEIYGCSRKSHCTSPGQPHQWGQKVAQWEASLPLPSHLPVTGSVPSLPLSSAPSFSVVGVWRVCRNLVLLTSTNFTGGEGNVHFQGWTGILFAWKMSGATRKSGERRLQASLWQFEREEVGKWNHVGIVSSFGAATLWRSHFCFPSPEFGENEDLWVSRREKGHEHHIIVPVGRLTIFFWFLFFFFTLCLFLVLFYEWSRKSERVSMGVDVLCT